MSLNSAFESALLSHIFQNAALANVGNAAGLPAATAAGSMFVSLHSQDPGKAAANQSIDELDYTGYGRKPGARSAGGWTVSGGNLSNAAVITMGKNTDGATQTSTHFGLGFATSGATTLYLIGTAALTIATNVNPSFAIGELDVDVT
jgi:hypothetical protein